VPDNPPNGIGPAGDPARRRSSKRLEMRRTSKRSAALPYSGAESLDAVGTWLGDASVGRPPEDKRTAALPRSGAEDI
jgi:hypothetical protein